MILEFLKKLWTLPQTIFGLFALLIFRAKKEQKYKDAIVYKVHSLFFSGVSLGQIIILNDYYFREPNRLEKTIKHEYGHTIQSYIFGPLYLLIIGLPSVCNNLIARVNKKVADNYYNLYPEKWADKLGGVER